MLVFLVIPIGGLARLDWALSDQPDAVIIILGGNDLLRGLDPQQTRENLEQILTRLQLRNIKVLLCGCRTSEFRVSLQTRI